MVNKLKEQGDLHQKALALAREETKRNTLANNSQVWCILHFFLFSLFTIILHIHIHSILTMRTNSSFIIF